jgi:creatinine amidohydrolase
MMMRLRPDLVGDYRNTPKVEWGNPFQPATRAWTMSEISAEGPVGQPSLATAEIGEALFQAFAADAVNFLGRVVEWDGRSWNG